MTAITPSSFIDDAIAELVNDWKGHDADFWQTNGEMVCRWHTAKIRSYLAWEERAEIRAHKKQFRDRFLAASNIKLRRLQEGIATYKHWYKQGDSVSGTAGRIWLEAGGWSKGVALAAPQPEKEEVEQKCKGCFHCPQYDEQKHVPVHPIQRD